MKPVRDFQFKRFSISQQGSTHKVGTDGVLLGAWVNISERKRILDIGTGSGVIALMLAQRTPDETQIDAVEIQHGDAMQARENVEKSPWKDKVKVHETSIQDFQCNAKYDLIVSNPPYFINSWLPPTGNRVTVRHTESLSFEDLLRAVTKHLSEDGVFAVILPVTEALQFVDLAKGSDLYVIRQCSFKSRAHKPIERLLLEFSFRQEAIVYEDLILHAEGEAWSEEYKALTRDFYLKS